MKTDISDIKSLSSVPFVLATENLVDLDNSISLFKPVIINSLLDFYF